MKYLNCPLLGQRMVTTNLLWVMHVGTRNLPEQMFHTPGNQIKTPSTRTLRYPTLGRWRYIWVSGALSHGPFQSTQQTYHHGKPEKHPWKLLHFLLQEIKGAQFRNGFWKDTLKTVLKLLQAPPWKPTRQKRCISSIKHQTWLSKFEDLKVTGWMSELDAGSPPITNCSAKESRAPTEIPLETAVSFSLRRFQMIQVLTQHVSSLTYTTGPTSPCKSHGTWGHFPQKCQKFETYNSSILSSLIKMTEIFATSQINDKYLGCFLQEHSSLKILSKIPQEVLKCRLSCFSKTQNSFFRVWTKLI